MFYEIYYLQIGHVNTKTMKIYMIKQ